MPNYIIRGTWRGTMDHQVISRALFDVKWAILGSRVGSQLWVWCLVSNNCFLFTGVTSDRRRVLKSRQHVQVRQLFAEVSHENRSSESFTLPERIPVCYMFLFLPRCMYNLKIIDVYGTLSDLMSNLHMGTWQYLVIIETHLILCSNEKLF